MWTNKNVVKQDVNVDSLFAPFIVVPTLIDLGWDNGLRIYLLIRLNNFALSSKRVQRLTLGF